MYIPIFGYLFGSTCITLDAPRQNALIKPRILKTRKTITAILCANYPLLVSMPMSSTTDGRSAVAGCVKRCTSAMPTANFFDLIQFADFSGRQIETVPRISRDTEITVRSWLEGTSYSRKLQQRMTREYKDGLHPCDDREFNVVGQFVKNERFPEFKAPRLINAKGTAYKFHFGSMVAEVEKIVYQMPEFIKSIPVRQRPHYITRMIVGPGRRYMTTDFTSFEANFTSFIMKNCENALLRHVFADHPLFPKMDWLCRSIESRQVCKSKLGYSMEVDATRMSGEMSTSLSNGFSNLMFMKYIFHSLGVTDLKIVVEGDDAIMSVPMDSRLPTEADFARLGLKVKLEEHSSISTASFCGIVFAEEDMINVTDPIAAVVEMNILSDKCAPMRLSKKMAFLKSKAMSAKYQYNGCPIIDAYASWILRETARYDVRVADARCSDWWALQKLIAREGSDDWKTRTQSPPATRRLVQDRYGISVSEQLALEALFDASSGLKPWYDPLFHSLCPEPWHRAWDLQTNIVGVLPVVTHLNDIPLPTGPCRLPHLAAPPRHLYHLFSPEMDGWCRGSSDVAGVDVIK